MCVCELAIYRVPLLQEANRDLVHWDPRFPFSPAPPPNSEPHRDGGEPGSELQCVCVCIYVRVCPSDVNFLFYWGSSVRVYRSFRFSLWEKEGRKKSLSSLMNQYGKRPSLCLGRTILSVTHLAPFPNANTMSIIKFKEVIHFFPPSQSPKQYHKVLLSLLAFFLK